MSARQIKMWVLAKAKLKEAFPELTDADLTCQRDTASEMLERVEHLTGKSPIHLAWLFDEFLSTAQSVQSVELEHSDRIRAKAGTPGMHHAQKGCPTKRAAKRPREARVSQSRVNPGDTCLPPQIQLLVATQ